MEPPAKNRNAPWILVGSLGVLAVGACLLAIGFAVLLPVLVQARENARFAGCVAHLKELTRACAAYMQSNDQRFPPASRWTDCIEPHANSPAAFTCPACDSYGYAMNSALSTKPLTDKTCVPGTPLFYDSAARTRNASDPVTSMPKPGRHQNAGRHIDNYVTPFNTVEQRYDFGIE